MVAKKKSSGKKKASKYVSTLPPFDFQPPSILDMGYKPPEYIKCRICNKSVASLLNFEWPAVPTDVTLAMIKDAIRKRHGGAATDLVLYKDQAKPERILRADDDGATLRDIGIRGTMLGPAKELPLVTILYDFGSAGQDDAIALVGPNQVQSRFGLDIKQYMAMEKEARQPK